MLISSWTLTSFDSIAPSDLQIRKTCCLHGKHTHNWNSVASVNEIYIAQRDISGYSVQFFNDNIKLNFCLPSFIETCSPNNTPKSCLDLQIDLKPFSCLLASKELCRILFANLFIPFCRTFWRHFFSDTLKYSATLWCNKNTFWQKNEKKMYQMRFFFITCFIHFSFSWNLASGNVIKLISVGWMKLRFVKIR